MTKVVAPCSTAFAHEYSSFLILFPPTPKLDKSSRLIHRSSAFKPKATAKRLPQYYRLFKSLVEENVTRTNSQLISEKIGVDAATIRRDFSLFGELGRRGYGYETKVLRDFFGELLGQDQETHIALIGVGNLVRA